MKKKIALSITVYQFTTTEIQTSSGHDESNNVSVAKVMKNII